MTDSRRIPLSLVLLLFFVSGASGLVYEVVWTRRLTLVFGSGLFATSTILATFMGGLALGSWWLGRRIDRRRDPLGFYGWLEIGVGVYALLLPLLLDRIIPVYQAVYRAQDGHLPAVNATRLGLSAALFLVPTVLMGGTLPALSRFVAREREQLGARVGRLYAFNTWGAVAGSLVAGFVLVETLGLRGSETLTAFANLAVGAVAVSLGARSKMPVETASEPGADRVPARADRGTALLVLVAYSLSGFAALGYEVIWVRFLTFYLGNSTYAFATMLGAFLVGLALGAMLMARIVDRIRHPMAWFALFEWLIGVSMALGLLVYPRAPYLYHTLSQLLPGWSWLEWLSLRFAVAFAILLAPTLLLGAAFPLAARLYVAGPRRVGAEIGALYAGNTVGAILGSLAAGFVLVPWLGFRDAVVLLVVLNAAIAAALALRATRWRLAIPVVSVALTLGASLLLPADVFLATIERNFPGDEILYYEEYPSATVFVTESPQGERWVHFSDKRASGGTMNLPGHRFWGHVPALLAERRESALVICFGSGITLGSVATHPFEKIVCAEICEGIREPAALFPENHGVLDDPRVELISDDGRNVLLGTDSTFDVIVSEPPLLETAGVVNLFTREFFELARARLAPGGVFCQWVPSFEFTKEQHDLILRTFRSVFPEATFWGSPLYADTILIGVNGPLPFDAGRIADRFAEERVRRDLAETGIADPAELLSFFGLSPGGLAREVGEGPIMTDDRTILDFVMPRTLIRQLPLTPVTLWKRSLIVRPSILEMQVEESVLPLLRLPPGSEALAERIERVERAHRLVAAGHAAGMRGDGDERRRLYEEALALAPDFTIARYYAALARVERAESEGPSALPPGRLAIAAEFPHLRRRLEALRAQSPT